MNISEADANNPTLLEHHQLCSIFNYFGLAVHHLTSRQSFGCLFLTTWMKNDFVEISGALLEQFCWETEIIGRVGQHWAYNSEFGGVWAAKQRTSNAQKPRETLETETIEQLQAWKANNEGLEKLKECQHAMFDMGFGRYVRSKKESSVLHHPVIWTKQLASRVTPFSMEAMEALNEDWEWGQCVPQLDILSMRHMARPTKLLYVYPSFFLFGDFQKRTVCRCHLICYCLP
jgi:Zn-dependent oligopeptidase